MYNIVVKKFKNLSPATKASIAFLFANLVLKGLSLISGPIFTRIMSIEQYGIVSTFQSWESLLAVIVTLNLSSGVFNNGMLEFRDARDEFQFSLLIISTISSLIYFFCFRAFRCSFLQFLELPAILVYVMFLYYLFVPAYWYWSGRQRYEYKYKMLTVITITGAVISLIIGIVAVYVTPNNWDAIVKVISVEAINIIIGIYFFINICIKAKFKINFQYCKYALKFNLPLIPHYLSIYVLASSDRIMISKIIDTSATAIYSVAYTVASVITIVWQSIEASLSPWIYEKLEVNKEEQVKNLCSKIVIFFAVLCIGCTLFAPEIMTILAPSSYSRGIYAIPPIAAGVFFTSLYSLYMRVELFYKQTKFAAFASIIAAVCNIILNYFFIRICGYIAAGYTTMICYALLAFLHYLNVKKRGYNKAFNSKTFLGISIIVIVTSIIVTLLYSMELLRYILIVCIVIGFIINKKILMQILSIRTE